MLMVCTEREIVPRRRGDAIDVDFSLPAGIDLYAIGLTIGYTGNVTKLSMFAERAH